jgi:hypothetical protein
MKEAVVAANSRACRATVHPSYNEHHVHRRTG